MTLAALFALLVQVGVCTPMHFKTPDRGVLTLGRRPSSSGTVTSARIAGKRVDLGARLKNGAYRKHAVIAKTAAHRAGATSSLASSVK